MRERRVPAPQARPSALSGVRNVIFETERERRKPGDTPGETGRVSRAAAGEGIALDTRLPITADANANPQQRGNEERVFQPARVALNARFNLNAVRSDDGAAFGNPGAIGADQVLGRRGLCQRGRGTRDRARDDDNRKPHGPYRLT